MAREQFVSDAMWEKLEPLLPELRSRGRPWRDSREVLEGVLWVLRSGARWKDLPSEYPSPSTCWRRLRRWEEDGTWLRVWRAFLAELDHKGILDWEETFADGSFASAKKGAPQSERPVAERVRSGWWWSTARVFLSEAPFIRPHRRR
jgi:transposase